MPEKIYERGLTPFDPEKHARFMTAEHYGFTFNSPVYPIDKASHLTSLGMFGNGPDSTLTVNGGKPMGNCGPCGKYHLDMITAALHNEVPPVFTANQVATDYFTYQAVIAGITWRPPVLGHPWSEADVAQAAQLDLGVDMGDYLLYEFNQGNIDAFFALKLNQVDAALDQFEAVICGWILTDGVDQDFEDDKIVDVGRGNEPDPQDGHCMPLCSVASANGDAETATWGGWLTMTGQARTAMLQQAFVILTKEQAQAHDFPYQAAVADLKALGGHAA